MFSASFKRVATAAALVLALPGAALAGVVVKSTGPSAGKYPVGTKLDDDVRITLKDGDAVTVLTAQGTRIIRGAGSFRVGDRPQVASDRFAALTRKRAATRVRTGAVRDGLDGEVTNPSLWYVDITRSGTVCLYDLATVRLWRPATEGTATYRISADAEGEAHADVTFDDTVTVAALDPARLPVREGTHYMVTGPDGRTTAHLDFVALVGDFEAPDALAEALIARGCTLQLETLANAFEQSAAAGMD
ncbi:hypothetical protein ACLBKU_01790 [Erythrobacter sp. NE805]|uniref:hypothetical protein n=1 Tax=Erythrobacter sp. NE805 TaxID=3389875 RepID=UPI00396B417C